MTLNFYFRFGGVSFRVKSNKRFYKIETPQYLLTCLPVPPTHPPTTPPHRTAPTHPQKPPPTSPHHTSPYHTTPHITTSHHNIPHRTPPHHTSPITKHNHTTHHTTQHHTPLLKYSVFSDLTLKKPYIFFAYVYLFWTLWHLLKSDCHKITVLANIDNIFFKNKKKR